MDLLTGIEKLGVPIAAVLILAWVFIKSVPPLVDSFIQARKETQAQLISVIEQNTAAMQALRDVTQSNCNQLAAHDLRVDGLGVTIRHIDDTTQDTHQLVRDIHAATVKRQS